MNERNAQTGDPATYMVLKTPTLPFVIPPTIRQISAMVNVVEKAYPTLDKTRPRWRGPRQLLEILSFSCVTRSWSIHTGPAQAAQNDPLAPENTRIRDAAPGHGREKLGACEAAL